LTYRITGGDRLLAFGNIWNVWEYLDIGAMKEEQAGKRFTMKIFNV
jgi:hypothetical protein